jgi:DNA (cytosine-5)-methyltransferase 1
MENVKNLVGKNHRADFQDWITRLEELGYANFWQVLNAKDYGIPQNRERVFMISILGGGNYTFPEKQLPTLRLRDILDDVVDDKYYLNVSYTPKQINKSTDVKVIGELDMRGNEQIRRLYDPNGIAPTLNTMQGGHRQPKIILDDTQGFDGVRLYKDYSPTLRAGRSGLKVVANTNSKHEQSSRVYDPDGLSPTIMSNSHGKTNGGYTAPKVLEDTHIRKLTPKECWRLMGFTDEQFDKVSFQSNTQLYKQAGKSIVVPVLEALFKELI